MVIQLTPASHQDSHISYVYIYVYIYLDEIFPRPDSDVSHSSLRLLLVNSYS